MMLQAIRVTVLLIAACALYACSDDSRPVSTGFLPNAADLISKPEPVVPDAAFEVEEVTRQQAEALIGTMQPTEDALEAEARWRTDFILWGREGWMQVDRLCRAAKAKLPDLPAECPPAR